MQSIKFHKVREKHFTIIIIIIIISPFLALPSFLRLPRAHHKCLCCASWFNHRQWRTNTTSSYNLHTAGLRGRTKPSDWECPLFLFLHRSHLSHSLACAHFMNHLKAWQMRAGSFFKASLHQHHLLEEGCCFICHEGPLPLVKERKERCREIKEKQFALFMIIVLLSDGDRVDSVKIRWGLLWLCNNWRECLTEITKTKGVLSATLIPQEHFGPSVGITGDFNHVMDHQATSLQRFPEVDEKPTIYHVISVR